MSDITNVPPSLHTEKNPVSPDLSYKNASYSCREKRIPDRSFLYLIKKTKTKKLSLTYSSRKPGKDWCERAIKGKLKLY